MQPPTLFLHVLENISWWFCSQGGVGATFNLGVGANWEFSRSILCLWWGMLELQEGLLGFTLESSPSPSLLKGYNTHLQWRCSKSFSNPSYYTTLEWRCSKPFSHPSTTILVYKGDALNRSHITTTIPIYSGGALNLSFSHTLKFS